MFINRGIPVSLRKKFENVYLRNLFDGDESRSGTGSSLDQTGEIRKVFPEIIRRLKISSILDIPCGDHYWMSKIDLVGAKYLGGDLSPTLISDLSSKYPDREFCNLNLVTDLLPTVDLVFCRDLFVHLSNKDIKAAMRNIILSNSKFLATTTFVDRFQNLDIPIISRSVAWRPINLQLRPFSFPEPLMLFSEKCTEANGQFKDKSIGIWEIPKLRNLFS